MLFCKGVFGAYERRHILPTDTKITSDWIYLFFLHHLENFAKLGILTCTYHNALERTDREILSMEVLLWHFH